jgi:penicillin-binding protein 1A
LTFAVRVRVRVGNPADGGVLYWLAKLYGFGACVMVSSALLTLVSVYGWFARSAPPIPDLRHYADVAPGITRVYAADGTPLAEFAEEWREVVPYERIPEKLVQAFLAAEDHRFFSHRGVDVKGVARAAWRNVTAGEFAQGGSTITQQVAKQFLGSEKTFARKIKEAIVARRLENRYGKREILSVYLNLIFLGSGAYGVQAAAQRYFSKNVWELDVAEMATIAGLAQAPSRDSPLSNMENATKRRDVILDKMARHGYLSSEEAEAWKQRPLVPRPSRDVFLSTEPYFAEHVRRQLVKTYGRETLMRGGLQVETTAQPVVDGSADDTVTFIARKQDKRQGWRGPEAHLDSSARETFLRRTEAHYGEGPLQPGRRYLALVESVNRAGARVRVGHHRLRLPLSRMEWASKWSRVDAKNDVLLESAAQALRPGDVVWVASPRRRVEAFTDWSLDDHLNPHWLPSREVKVPEDEVELEQTPRVQASIYAMDHQTGYVLGMVGGQDYSRSELNRATQSCRQPGSTYKPIYYSLALDKGYSFDTMLNDIPKAEVDPLTGEVWVPVNLHGTVDFQVSLEYALVYSKNVPSVDIFTKVGGKEVEAWARRLGFTSPIIPDKALALGASCTYIDELTRAFAIFARQGRWIEPIYVKRVLDREGRVLEDRGVYFDDAVAAAVRLDRLAATAGVRAREAIPARTAWLIGKLMREVVTHGFSTALRQTDIPVAGKTGTSSATMDLWFVGYTSRWAIAAWIGDDVRERPLGKDDAAYMSTLPMFARFIKHAAHGLPHAEVPGPPPPGVRSSDRGGTKGRAADGQPMPLTPPKKMKSLDVPPGMRASPKRPSG